MRIIRNTIIINPGSVTTYLKNKILNFLFQYKFDLVRCIKNILMKCNIN